MAAGGAWRVKNRYPAFAAYFIYRTNRLALPLQNGDFELEFAPVPGFSEPELGTVALVCTTVTNLVVNYTQVLPQLRIVDRTNLVLYGLQGQSYRIEYTEDLGTSSHWVTFRLIPPLTTISNLMQGALSGSRSRVYRAVQGP